MEKMVVAEAVDQLSKCLGVNATTAAVAPGRVEVIGNHTDYNGGLVMGATIDRYVAAAGALRVDRLVRFASPQYSSPVTIQLDAIAPLTGSERWANYPSGVVEMLRREGVDVTSGFDVAFASSLPTGAGLSSSAALELATAYVLLGMFPAQIDKKDVTRACRRAENDFVGVPSGILDQTVSAFGRSGRVVSIDCLTEEHELMALPPGTHFWIFNSHNKHALVASLYAARHRECQEALVALKNRYPWAERLVDLSGADVRAAEDLLPQPLYLRALHVASEHERVGAAKQALRSSDASCLGRLLFDSHESSRSAFENSTPQLDFLVGTLSTRRGVWGARLTGGGFGGAVLALTSDQFGTVDAAAVRDAYRARFDAEADVFHCVTSEGARGYAL